MNSPRMRVILSVGAIIAVLAQVVLAPVLAIGYAMPNFILAYVIVVAIIRAHEAGYALPFVLGLAYDLIGNGPVGAMAFICVLATAVLSWARSTFDNGTLFISIILLVFGTFICNILYGFLIIACGANVGFLDSLIYRSLPAGLYDTVVGFVFLPIMLRLIAWGSGATVRAR